jgi:predicted lipoprotein
LNRRRFVALLSAPLFVGCARRDRGAVLEALVRGVVADMAQGLTRRTRSLHDAVDAYESAPSASARAAARLRFGPAARSWKRAQVFRSGPFASSQAFHRAAFWPIDPSAIERAVSAAVPFEQLVEGSAVDARGLWALEYSLFSPGFEASSSDPKLAAYSRELSANVVGYAERLARLLGDGRLFARSFSAAGAASVAALHAHSVDTLEVARGKLERARLAVTEGTPLERAVEGYYSASSTDVLRAVLSGAEALFEGGLAELAASVEPEVAGHVRAAFSRLNASASALPPRLEVAAAIEPQLFRSVELALGELRHVYLVELGSALEAAR